MSSVPQNSGPTGAYMFFVSILKIKLTTGKMDVYFRKIYFSEHIVILGTIYSETLIRIGTYMYEWLDDESRAKYTEICNSVRNMLDPTM